MIVWEFSNLLNYACLLCTECYGQLYTQISIKRLLFRHRKCSISYKLPITRLAFLFTLGG